MGGCIKDFRDLRIWQKGRKIVRVIYEVTREFPKEEIYGLTSQMRKAAVSIPSNIAEGFGRFHKKEYRQFLFHAKASCSELVTQIILSEDLNFIHLYRGGKIKEVILDESRMISGLIKKL